MTPSKTSPQKMELLAPAGSLAVFETAVEAGADAVYIGAPGMHARAIGKDFSMADIAAMISYARGKGKKVFLAANSLIKESEIPAVVKTMALIEALEPDGLIVQDVGLYSLVRRYFPTIRLHASTLLGAHNSFAVRQFAKMGFARVVLARELTLSEIIKIRATSEVELEVFVHGALCFSYSGLCLFSSALGGKSGLRGRCVQPCRRRYSYESGKARSIKGKPGKQAGAGYLFSMNDLAALRILPDLQKAGVTSLKIEGRLRSVHYVDSVVRAYRTVLDEIDDKGQVGKSVMSEAEEFLREAMGRRTTTGYFSSSRPPGIISPYHSGNIGIFLGRVEKRAGKDMAGIYLKKKISVGDRLRLHCEKSGERVSFTLKQIQKKGESAQQAAALSHVALAVPTTFYPGDSLYMVDSRAGRSMERRRRSIDPKRFAKKITTLNKKISVEKILYDIAGQEKNNTHPARSSAAGKMQRQGPRTQKQSLPLKMWIKTDQLQLLKQRLPFPVEHMVVTLNHDLFQRFLRIKNFKAKPEKIIWALPSVILEEDLAFFENAIQRLRKYGFFSFQLGHISQLQFFHKKSQFFLTGDYTLNVLNSQTLGFLNRAGVKAVQAAIESDKAELSRLSAQTKLMPLRYKQTLQDLAEHGRARGKRTRLGMTVYGTPPLFSSRLAASHFVYGKPFVSPKGEKFVLKRQESMTIALSERPFSLLPALAELSAMGFEYAVVGLCNQPVKGKDIDLLVRRLAGKVRERKLSTFNYEGQLL